MEVLINKWIAMQAVQRIDCVATLRDGDPVIRMSAVEHVLENLPEAEPEAISKWKKEFREYVDSLDITRDDWKGIIEYIDELPSAEPYTTTHDSIPAKTGKNDGDGTSGDCISRQQAIDAFYQYPNINWTTLDVMEKIKELPSIQPERKTGRWIPDNTDYYRTRFICSACGESEEVPTTGFGYGTMWDYCPMCGAKMKAGGKNDR